jgi:hypothetical protein
VKDVRALALQFGLDLGELEDVIPLQVETKIADTGDTQPDESDSTSDPESDDEVNDNETT